VLTKDSLDSVSQIVLSRRNGFVKFPNFKKLIRKPSTVLNPGFYQLVGWQSVDDNKGLDVDLTASYFNRVEGDKLLYKVKYSSNSLVTPEHHDGYLEVTFSKDSLGAIKERKVYYNRMKIQDTEPSLHINSYTIEIAKQLVLNAIPGIRSFYGDYLYTSKVQHKSGKIKGIIDGRPAMCYGTVHGASGDFSFEEPFGLMNYTGSWGPLYTHEINLIAAQTSRGDYGSWPQNLGTELSRIGDFSIWPNPTNGQINIKSDEYIIEVRVLNNIGQFTSLDDETTINLKNLEEGVYFIQVKMESGEKTKKVILIH
jgi:hypothetical protein